MTLPSFAMRSFAVNAVTALEQHLTLLLGVSDVLASQGHSVACREMRRARRLTIERRGRLRAYLVEHRRCTAASTKTSTVHGAGGA